MAGSTDVVVKYVADTSQLHDATTKAKTSISGIAKVAIGAGVAMGGMFAIRQVGDFVNAAEEAEHASNRLAKVLENAGDTTGDWWRKAEDLSETLMKQTGVDDEIIKGGQAILATFHGLSGEVGQTSGAFDRATRAAVDMAAAGFGDVESASVQLGKALEDPIKGITALGRSGITFSEDQKKAIKAMVETGDKAGAMNLILQNVESQIGGTAAATVTSSDKMAVAWGEAQEALGALLLPLVDRFTPALQAASEWMQDSLIPALGDLADQIIDTLGPAFSAAVDWIRDDFVPALTGIVDWVQDNREEVGSYFTPFMDAARNVIPKIGAIAVAFGKLAIVIAQWLWPKLQDLGEWLSDHREVIGIMATTITVALVPAFYAWAAAAAAASAATVIAGITAGVAFAPILLAIGAVVTALYVVWRLLDESGVRFHHFWGILQTIYNWIKDHWVLLGAILTGPFGWAAKAIYDHWGGVTAFFQALPGVIGGFFADLGLIIAKPFIWAGSVIGAVVGTIYQFFAWLVEKIVRIVDRIVSAVERVRDVFASIQSGRPGFGVPGELPGGLAAGGIVRRPTLASIGEPPEAVVPLRRAGTMPGLGTVNIYVTTTGLGASSPQIQSAVAAALRNYTDRNGAI